MAWGQQPQKAEGAPAKAGYDKEYYRNMFKNNTAHSVPVRMALVAKENCGKTGLAVSIIRQVRAKGRIYVFDIDNSAQATLEPHTPTTMKLLFSLVGRAGRLHLQRGCVGQLRKPH